MSFDWMSFATGFMERTSDILQERQAEAKQYEKEQKAAAERNAASISRRRAITDRVTGYANYLASNGVSDAQLQAVISTGPEAIEELTKLVQTEVQRNGGRPLGSSDVSALISMPEGFTPLDMTRQEFIDQTYGLSTTAVDKQEQEEFGFVDRLFGRDQMARAEERLRETPYIEGMTIEQINQAAMQGDYQSLIPGTFAAFAGDTSYDITEQGVDFMRDFNMILDETMDSDRYNPISILESGIKDEEGIEAEQNRILIESVEPLIFGYAKEDAVGFMRAHESQLRNRLGDTYVDQLKERLGLSAPEPSEEESTDTSFTETPEPDTEAPQPIVDNATPDVVEPTVDNATPDVVAPDSDVVEAPTNAREVWNRIKAKRDMLPPGPERVRLSNLMNRINVSTTPIEKALEIFDLANEVPVVEAPQDVPQEAEIQPAENEVYQKMSEQGVDDISITLLDSHGRDMVDYVKEQGATTDEELVIALSEWGQRNNIVMPFDKSALIYALKLVIDQ